MTKGKEQQDDPFAGMTPDLANSLRSLKESMDAKAEREKAAAAEEGAASEQVPVVQLPLWPEPARGAPNDILRSALFAAVQGKGREYLKQHALATCEGHQIKYTGEQLDQSDLDVWEHVLHLARQHPLGTVCHFKGGAFLKAIGRNAGRTDYRWLHSVLLRLSSCTVEFYKNKDKGKKIYGRGMIAAYDIDESSRCYMVTIDTDTAKLYAAGWTAIDWQQRQQLRGKPLALWLHGYYATHAEPLPVKVETLRNLSGSKTAALFKFRQQLRKSLDELVAVGALASWEIDDADLVTVRRGNAITASQRRHLMKANKPRRKRKE